MSQKNGFGMSLKLWGISRKITDLYSIDSNEQYSNWCPFLINWARTLGLVLNQRWFPIVYLSHGRFEKQIALYWKKRKKIEKVAKAKSEHDKNM